MLKRHIQFLFILTFVGCSSSQKHDDIPKGDKGGFQGLVISIDGAQAEMMRAFVGANIHRERNGLEWFYQDSLNSLRAESVDISITAPSHISNVTCSRPINHGIYANSFLVGGKKVSGYTYPIRTETLWQAAKRQGLRVAAFGYVGADGASEDRRPAYGISYPDDKLVSKPQVLKWNLADLPSPEWLIPSSSFPDVASFITKSAEFQLELNPVTKETVPIHVLFLIDSKLKNGFVAFDSDRDLSNGYFGQTELKSQSDFVNLFAVEKNGKASTFGYKRRAFLRIIPDSNGSVSILVSGASYNNAYPASYRAWLDQQNLVWGDQARYVPMKGVEMTPQEVVEFDSVLSRTLADIAERSLREFPANLVLFYQPLIDGTGHRYHSHLPSDWPTSQNAYAKAMRIAYEIVDRNVASLVRLTDSRTHSLLVGDHGMEKSFGMLNVATAVPELLEYADVVSATAYALIYGKNGKEVPPRILDAAEKKLSLTKFRGKPVLFKFERRSEGWIFGEAQARFVAGKGMGLIVLPEEASFLEKHDGGAHGYPVDWPSMKTIFAVKGPRVTPKILEDVSLIDALPTLTKFMGIAPPKNCEGKPLQ